MCSSTRTSTPPSSRPRVAACCAKVGVPDRCKVAVVTNIGSGDHLGLNYITTVEDLAILKRVVVQNVAPDGVAVLDAADPIVAAMAESCPGSVTFFAVDRHHPVMVTHRAQGGRVVYIDGDAIVAAERGRKQRIALSEVPVSRNGSIRFQVENAMGGHGSRVGGRDRFGRHPRRTHLVHVRSGKRTRPLQCIRLSGRDADRGLRPQSGCDACARLRDRCDYGQPPPGCHQRRRRPARPRSPPADRDPGSAFDEVILFQDKCQRGRPDGEVVHLLRQGLSKATRARVVDEIRGEFLAIDTALARLEPRDLCLVLVDQVQEALTHITKRIAQG